VHVVKVTKTTIRLAPADEYFGPLKMSVLGIRNVIHDLAIRYDVRSDGNHALAKQIMGTALMTEASLQDWEKKYPADNQLPRDVYLMQHLYAKIDSDDARAKAKYCASWLFTRYKASWYAKNLHQTLAHDPGPPPAPAAEPAAPAAVPPPASSGSGTSSGSDSSGSSGSSSTSGSGGSGSTSGSTSGAQAAVNPPASH
jgi:uncharacterized membrane protein YgcG